MYTWYLVMIPFGLAGLVQVIRTLSEVIEIALIWSGGPGTIFSQ